MVEDMLNDLKAICDQKSTLRRDLDNAREEQISLVAELTWKDKELEMVRVANDTGFLAKETERGVYRMQVGEVSGC
jgi:hypothetical protein